MEQGDLFEKPNPLQKALTEALRLALPSEAMAPEYEHKWKRRKMVRGLPIPRLTARARRTSAGGCSGWPSPKAQEDGRTLEQYEAGRRRGYKKRQGKTRGGPASKMGGLAIAAQLAGWA